MIAKSLFCYLDSYLIVTVDVCNYVVKISVVKDIVK